VSAIHVFQIFINMGVTCPCLTFCAIIATFSYKRRFLVRFTVDGKYSFPYHGNHLPPTHIWQRSASLAP
jgi:hypothetical protein